MKKGRIFAPVINNEQQKLKIKKGAVVQFG